MVFLRIKMKYNGKQERIKKILLWLLWIGTVLVSVKSIFTDFGIDGAYQIAMSYRHISGDSMLLEMWEPHQTSIFLNDILIYVYRLFVPSLTGVAIYLQLCGTLLFAGIGYFLYRALKEYTGKFAACLAWMFFIVFRAKQIPTVEYANLEIAASVIAFILLVKFFRNEKAVFLPLIAGAVFLQILSYPTCIISIIAVILILVLFSQKKIGNSLIFVGSLAAFGLCYALYFVIKIGPSLIIRAARNILMADSHTSYRFGGYWTGFLTMTLALVICAAVGTVAAFIMKKTRKRTALNTESATEVHRFDMLSYGMIIAAGTFALMEVIMLAIQKKSGIDWMCSIYILPIVLFAIGMFGLKKLTSEERKIYLTGAFLSLASFAATLILTNLGMITIVAYLVLAAVVSFIPISKMIEGHKAFITLILLAVLIHRGIVIWGIGNTNGRVHMIWEAQNFIRQGPAAGVVCDHFNKAYTDTNIEEFKTIIQPDDKVFFVGEGLLDSLVYVYSGAEISNYSTIDTPFYNECLEEYFEINPEKKPTLIASASWFGSSSIPEDSYVMKWVEDNYEVVYEGSYWTYWR